MTRKAILAGMAVLWVTGLSVGAETVEIARWNSSGSVPKAEFFEAIAVHPHLTAAHLVRGSGLGTAGGAGNNTFWATGYDNGTDNEMAMANGNYWQTSFTPDAERSISFTTLLCRFRSTGTGPQQAQWAYSLNGSTYHWIGSAFTPPGTYSETEIDLSAVPGLQNLTGQVWFRLAAWNASASTGPGAFGQNADVLIFSGTIVDDGPVPPTVWFDPSGAQSVAVSNELSLAVSATPEGSGLQSWSMVPAYSGSANLTGGIFTFTPAGPDNGKALTLSVVATNAVGASTGTVSITVTPYVVPVPDITFHPAGPYGIMATETQTLGIAVSPAGSGIDSWELLPAYSGSASLVGTNFTFATLEADGPETYTLSVVATNVHGATTGTAEIAVSLYIPAPPPGSVVVDFEDAEGKTAYAPDVRTLSGRSWLVGGVIGTLAGDKKFGEKSLRIRCNAADDSIKLRSETPFNDGIESISLWYAMYGTDSTNNPPKISIQISTALESDWITLDTIDTGSAIVLTSHVVEVKVKEPVYLRLWAPQAGTGVRANIDNIVIAPYVLPTGYDAFLLSYNVTPGDPGTAPDDDLDGDGWTNQEEFVAGTNPYDPDVHP